MPWLCVQPSTVFYFENGFTPLHQAALNGHTTCVDRLISTPGIIVNIKSEVNWIIECTCSCINNSGLHVHVQSQTILNPHMI